MSGIVGNYFEPRTRKLFGKILGVDMLGKQYGEYNIALLHILESYGIQLTGTILSILISYWLVLVVIPIGAVKIVVDEWPKEGRRIDVVTRGFGWLVGALIGFFICLPHVDWYFPLGIFINCLLVLGFLFFDLEKDVWA